MSRKSTRVFLTPATIRQIQAIVDAEGMTFSQAANELIHRGYERREKKQP